MGLLAKSVGQYVNGKGNLVYRYIVTGSKADIERYEELQGVEFLRHDEKTGAPLYFSSKSLGAQCPLVFTQNDKIVPDFSELNHLASLSAQFANTPLGAEIARAAAQKLVGDITGKGRSTSSAPVADVAEAPVLEDDADVTEAPILDGADVTESNAITDPLLMESNDTTEAPAPRSAGRRPKDN